jgi:hypothetical protein
MALTVLEVDRLLRHESDLLGVFQFLGSVQLRQWPLTGIENGRVATHSARLENLLSRFGAGLRNLPEPYIVGWLNHLIIAARCIEGPVAGILLKGWQEVLRETLKKSEKP